MLIGGRGNLVNRVVSLCKKYEITEGKCKDTDLARIDADENKLFAMFDTGFDAHMIQQTYLGTGNIQ